MILYCDTFYQLFLIKLHLMMYIIASLQHADVNNNNNDFDGKVCFPRKLRKLRNIKMGLIIHHYAFATRFYTPFRNYAEPSFLRKTWNPLNQISASAYNKFKRLLHFARETPSDLGSVEALAKCY